MARTEPRHKVKLVKNVMIPTRDGVRLAADLIMPEEEGKFPALIQYHPYRKDDISIGNNDAHHFFAERGYVGVRLDVRGTGSSEGHTVEEYSPEETRDGVDAINWIADQDWCTRDVGMFGWSYSGQTSMIAAINAPKPLKAIVCGLFSDDRYQADCHYQGGSVMPMLDYGLYGTFMISWNAMPPYPEYSGEMDGALEEQTGEERTLDDTVAGASGGRGVLETWLGEIPLRQGQSGHVSHRRLEGWISQRRGTDVPEPEIAQEAADRTLDAHAPRRGNPGAKNSRSSRDASVVGSLVEGGRHGHLARTSCLHVCSEIRPPRGKEGEYVRGLEI